MAEYNSKKWGEIIKNNFLAVSILTSAVLLAITLFVVFGPNVQFSLTPSSPNVDDEAANEEPLSLESLKGYAMDLGVDEDEFDNCLDSSKYAVSTKADTDQGLSLGVTGTPTFFINGTKIIGAVPFDQFSSSIDSALSSAQTGVVDIDIGNSPVLGDKDAPVTIVEFTDYECPFCVRFFVQTLPLIKSNYIDTGKVKFVFKDFPLTNMHLYAQKAAEAAECVRDQLGNDGYWKMHDILFGVQT